MLLGIDLMVRVQGAMQVPLDQITQVEGRLTGPGEVGGERGVAGDAVDGPAADGQRVDGRLEIVTDLGRRRVGEPGRQRGLVIRIGLHHVDDGGLTVRRGQCQGVHVAAVRCPGAAHHQSDPAGRRAP